MAVTVASSQVVQDGAQKDGRCYVTETFNLSNGDVVVSSYLAPKDFDVATHLAATAVQLIADLTSAEINNNVNQVMLLGSLANPVLLFSLAVDNFAALRVAYATMTQVQAVMAADFINTLTNAQISTAFNISLGTAATLRTNRLAPAATIAASIRSAVGQ